MVFAVQRHGIARVVLDAANQANANASGAAKAPSVATATVTASANANAPAPSTVTPSTVVTLSNGNPPVSQGLYASNGVTVAQGGPRAPSFGQPSPNPPAPSAAAGITAAAKTPIPGMPANYTLGSALAGASGLFAGTAVATGCEVATAGTGGFGCVVVGAIAGEAANQAMNNGLAHIANMANQKKPVVTMTQPVYLGPVPDAGHGDGGRANATSHGGLVGHVTSGPVSDAGSSNGSQGVSEGGEAGEGGGGEGSGGEGGGGGD